MKSKLSFKIVGFLLVPVFVLLVFLSCQPGRVEIADPIATKAGKVSGTVVDDGGVQVRLYKGIPYAAPPVGDLRWKPPQPVEPWEGIRDCKTYANRAPQRAGGGMGVGSGISEDCLYLNVITAAKTTAERLPVMVFFHGGGLTSGTGNSPTYCNTALPRKGVVVVTVNSRLGPIGYMAHPALTAESEHHASGNYGTLDLIASLKWVKENITAFGGNPDNVLIFGESGGGTKTLSCMTSPLAKGLFHRAIVESGSASISPRLVTTLESGEATGKRLAAKLGVDGQEDVLAALRAISWEKIIEAASDRDVNYRANLTVDGWVLPQSVNDTFKQGKQHDVPLIVGANEGEQGELATNVPMLAGLMSGTATSNAYVYVFSHLPTGWKAHDCVAFHGVELPYVFGYVPEGLSAPVVRALSMRSGCAGVDPGPDEKDQVVAENTMKLWAQFAATGNPSVEGLVTWPAYTEDNDQYLDIGYTLEVKKGVADAYVSPPQPKPAEPVSYSNADYGFSLKYPGNWRERTENLGPNVIWRVGQGANFIPSMRVIVLDRADKSDLETAFRNHLQADEGKTIKTITTKDATINGTAITQADLAYGTDEYSYESMIVGCVKEGKWIIFEVYTVPAFGPFANEGQKAELLNSVSFN